MLAHLARHPHAGYSPNINRRDKQTVSPFSPTIISHHWLCYSPSTAVPLMPPTKAKKKSKSSRVTPNAAHCEGCGQPFSARGIAQHRKACVPAGVKPKPNRLETLLAYEMELTAKNSKAALVPGPTLDTPQENIPAPRSSIPVLLSQQAQLLLPPALSVQTTAPLPPIRSTSTPASPSQDHSLNNDHGLNTGSPMNTGSPVGPGPDPTQLNTQPAAPHYVQGDIRVEYHPKSRRQAKHIPAKEFRNPDADSRPAPRPDTLPTTEPWFPFRTRLDFELADFIQDAGLNAGQIEELLSWIEQCTKDPTSYTLSGKKDLTNLWTLARMQSTGRQCRRRQRLHGESVYLHVQTGGAWDAEKVYVYRESIKDFEHRIDEPWTADSWWGIQSELPAGASPFCILLYADKTHLSSFGTSGQKGYPVLARCANLPVEFRNSDGVEGARVVGWLPVVPEDPGETGKKGFKNHKRIVWHEGFLKILETMKDWAKIGHRHTCAGGVKRWIFPVILIFSCDFEEQCIVAAVRGTNAGFPCPVCLVPDEELSDLTKKFELRTSDHMQRIYETAQEMPTVAQKELTLKGFGLRDVENVFWAFKHMDIYAAISWDRLHAYHGGLFKDHLWVEFKGILYDLAGKPGAKEIEDHFGEIPRYRGLHHFNAVMKIDFSDGTKWEDISKIIVYVAHDMFSPTRSKKGYHLLQLLRSYLELDMYASLTIHTTSTIAAGRMELLTYDKLLKQYVQKFDTKSWNFPKNHTHIHLFDDIENKGVTRNYNTKPNEKRHRPFKKVYRNQVNFKNIAEQILRHDHNSLVADIIRREIDSYDNAVADAKQAADERTPIQVTPRLQLGSVMSTLTMGEVETKFATDDSAFRDFRKKVSKALARELGIHIRLDSQHEATSQARASNTAAAIPPPGPPSLPRPTATHRAAITPNSTTPSGPTTVEANIRSGSATSRPSNEPRTNEQSSNPSSPQFGSVEAGNETLQEALYTLQERFQEQEEMLTKITVEKTKMVAQQGAREQPDDPTTSLHTAAIKKFVERVQKAGRWYQLYQSLELIDADTFRGLEPPFEWDDPIRYDPAYLHLGAAADLRAGLGEELFEKIEGSDTYIDLFLKAMSPARSLSIDRMRKHASADIFKSFSATMPHRWLTAKFKKRSEIPKIRQLLGITTSSSGETKYASYPPILYEGEDPTNERTLFLHEFLIKVDVASGERAKPKSTSSYYRRDRPNQVTPGLIAWIATMIRFIMSDDGEYGGEGEGAASHICYIEDYNDYKEVLIRGMARQSPRVANVFRTWNQKIFGKEDAGSKGGEDFGNERLGPALREPRLDKDVEERLRRMDMEDSLEDEEESGGNTAQPNKQKAQYDEEEVEEDPSALGFATVRHRPASPNSPGSFDEDNMTENVDIFPPPDSTFAHRPQAGMSSFYSSTPLPLQRRQSSARTNHNFEDPDNGEDPDDGLSYLPEPSDRFLGDMRQGPSVASQRGQGTGQPSRATNLLVAPSPGDEVRLSATTSGRMQKAATGGKASRTSARLQSQVSRRDTPRSPLCDKVNRKSYRNGYETKPKTPSYRPYTINNPGRARTKAFAFPTFPRLQKLKPLTADEWNRLAWVEGVLGEGMRLKDYQVEAANVIVSRERDLCIVAPTGSGKSLTWVLPLLAQGKGISLVVVPFTSLGFQGEQRHSKTRIQSTFTHSGAAGPDVLERIALGGTMQIIYVCVEMLETPAFARVLYSESFQAQLSGIYIDEAHVVHESYTWRPAYTRLGHVRRIIGTSVPIICLSATFPKRYRDSLEAYAALRPSYHLINLGNHRPELSSIVARMRHDATSFLDLAFVLPSNATQESLKQAIIYCDDLEMLTAMFWWFHARLREFELPISLLDILHSGLSEDHQLLCTEDFIRGKTRILLGSDKIGAGMDFPTVSLVVQYRCRDLTLVRWEQRRGRGARRDGSTAVGVILVEKSMTGDDGDLSVLSPKTEDPALLDLIHSTSTCHIAVIDHWLENPPRQNSYTICEQCSNCNPNLRVDFELSWIMESAASLTTESITRRKPLSAEERKQVHAELVKWRYECWTRDWMEEWPSYGPDSLVSDTDVEEIANRILTVFTIEHLQSHARIVHIQDLSAPLLDALQDIRVRVCGVNISVSEPEAFQIANLETTPARTPHIPLPSFQTIQWAAPDGPETMRQADESQHVASQARKRKTVTGTTHGLAEGESVVSFSSK
ncbi:hypothetical protein D9613_012725 [Agrocybe pediades]|uniref:DNA 3'-5' helicase n=1 Tax=Agrocybe pediades TaxID=84607 RepID=A0A8H4VK44_9AGAR|nr:hypothetical protein D9613_012725 [Agrocybe pediades]